MWNGNGRIGFGVHVLIYRKGARGQSKRTASNVVARPVLYTQKLDLRYIWPLSLKGIIYLLHYLLPRWNFSCLNCIINLFESELLRLILYRTEFEYSFCDKIKIFWKFIITLTTPIHTRTCTRLDAIEPNRAISSINAAWSHFIVSFTSNRNLSEYN